MTVQSRNGKTVVMAPFAGSPAYKAGLRPGDVILEVNDKKTDDLSATEVADLLKGPQGTQVQVVVARDGVDKPITFNIIRDEIPRYSVPDAFWLKPGIAYLKIDQFNENTSKEMERQAEAARREEHQGSGSRPARKSGRPVERRRRSRRTFSEEERTGGEPSRTGASRTRSTPRAAITAARIIRSWWW